MKMNRKVLSLLLTGVILMLLLPMNSLANDECGCGVVILEGSEKNKIIADYLKSDALKEQRKELKEQGYQWIGVGGADVQKNPFGVIMIIVPILTETGQPAHLLYAFGEFRIAE